MKQLILNLTLLISIFAFMNESKAQGLGAKLTLSDSKYHFNEPTFEVSFTLEAPTRNEINKTFLMSQSTNYVSEITIFLDDVRPIAAVILKAPITTKSEFEALLKNLYGQWNLNWISINGQTVTSKENIHL